MKNYQTDQVKECSSASSIMQDLERKYPEQPTFLQAVKEMEVSISDLLEIPIYAKAFALLTEPERIIAFRVNWMDDNGILQFNRGWRVEFNSVLGPYKGGLRFHPTVNLDVLKFLGFEQIFKNALTGLPLGGGKGGSDFNPRGKSNGEIRRFCQAFMLELHRHVSPTTDVPAGDMGVGGREIGYLYGMYKSLTNRHGEGGVLTGKSVNIGGSNLRPEATGYGLVYMAEIGIKKYLNKDLRGLKFAISGSGNVATFAAQKVLELGGIVVSLSDSNGTIVFDKLTTQDLETIMECKNQHRGRLSSVADAVSGEYFANQSPWDLLIESSSSSQKTISFDIGLPCATQNEISDTHATAMIDSGVQGVLEGANLPSTMAAQEVFRANNILYIPGKASNAGGVGVSGMEMSQNAQHLRWDREVVDEKLKAMMENIYHVIDSSGDTLEQGANRAGFLKVATAMQELGWLY